MGATAGVARLAVACVFHPTSFVLPHTRCAGRTCVSLAPSRQGSQGRKKTKTTTKKKRGKKRVRGLYVARAIQRAPISPSSETRAPKWT
ncbi:uncharacterized protein [Physcomitrium patens]|uniref:uncharacterized protein isoform X2 n=1 Tax=Physcomitrium patens TaxID=3218 RepID=UPI003CCD223F